MKDTEGKGVPLCRCDKAGDVGLWVVAGRHLKLRHGELQASSRLGGSLWKCTRCYSHLLLGRTAPALLGALAEYRGLWLPEEVAKACEGMDPVVLLRKELGMTTALPRAGVGFVLAEDELPAREVLGPWIQAQRKARIPASIGAAQALF